jgi:hypothetical protein
MTHDCLRKNRIPREADHVTRLGHGFTSHVSSFRLFEQLDLET